MLADAGAEPFRLTRCEPCSLTLGIPVFVPGPDAERHASAHAEPDAARSISEAFAKYAADTRAIAGAHDRPGR